ncbi:MAG TPA: TonB-dependent receptor, partial [Brevundimonas sp.]|nr:TonB-dependent receptor [Brevundimonas sp.]
MCFSSQSRQRFLLATTALISAGLAASAQAQVQDNPTAEVDEIVVTGQREAQRAAIAVKRAEFEVMDAVSADDIGKLPDHNTAAALRRIPGVSVMEDQGEPRWPILRGLASTYNRTTIDGAFVGSVDESARTVPMDIVPSVMAGRVEVIKTVTPENDGNAIGGVINVATRSAFDAAKPFFNGMASYGVYEQHGDVRNDDPSYRLAFAAGRRFGAADEWGVVIGASHEQLDYDIPQAESAAPSIREYDAAGKPVNSGAPTGNGIQVPTQLRLFWYNNTKQRSGANGKLEWRPSVDFRWEASALYARMEDDEERTEFRTEPVGNVTNQTRTSGTFATGRNIIGLNQPITRREIGLGRTAFRWDAAPQWRLDGDLVYSQAGSETPNTSMEFRTASNANFGFRYDTSNFFPVFTPTNPTAFRDPTLFNLQQRRVSLLRTDEDTTQARFNLAFDDGGETRNLKAKVGAVWRSNDRSYRSSRTDYTAKPGFIYTLDQVDRPGPDKLIEGQYRLTPRIDVATAEAFYAANADSFNVKTAAPTGDYDVTEDVFAGYAQASYRVGDLTLLGGLRYEKTEVSSDAARLSGGVLTPVSNSGDYDNWLPSLHLRWNLRQNMVVRAAWTNTIGRPDFGSLAASESISFDGSQPTLSRGNPGLKARESEGLDLSFEYYPTDGLMSVALFTKDIDNEIFTLSSVQNLDVGRGVEAVIVSTPTNAETAKIRGVEVAFQQALTMLPAPFDGLGVSANATFLDTEFTFLTTAGKRHTGLFQQPATTTNESIWYQRGPIEARVSHNYIGGFLETINDTIP